MIMPFTTRSMAAWPMAWSSAYSPLRMVCDRTGRVGPGRVLTVTFTTVMKAGLCTQTARGTGKGATEVLIAGAS